ncbi:hypothetical protein GALMADRAFT_272411 [Galerina marginata CBS 339.88]|uniref:Ion transport domain-containing protein n=1 Tax=Galerina marginata (strain CBS 339.88) TaxID=685588 RepID=A0A067SFL2_GALM3|nr:hypothetical protein GALMADRAFT_272411 [Galerina marginata CBS 339.88]
MTLFSALSCFTELYIAFGASSNWVNRTPREAYWVFYVSLDWLDRCTYVVLSRSSFLTQIIRRNLVDVKVCI